MEPIDIAFILGVVSAFGPGLVRVVKSQRIQELLDLVAPRPPHGWVASTPYVERAAGLVFDKIGDYYHLWPGYYEWDQQSRRWYLRPEGSDGPWVEYKAENTYAETMEILDKASQSPVDQLVPSTQLNSLRSKKPPTTRHLYKQSKEMKLRGVGLTVPGTSSHGFSGQDRMVQGCPPGLHVYVIGNPYCIHCFYDYRNDLLALAPTQGRTCPVHGVFINRGNQCVHCVRDYNDSKDHLAQP